MCIDSGNTPREAMTEGPPFEVLAFAQGQDKSPGVHKGSDRDNKQVMSNSEARPQSEKKQERVRGPTRPQPDRVRLTRVDDGLTWQTTTSPNGRMKKNDCSAMKRLWPKSSRNENRETASGHPIRPGNGSWSQPVVLHW